MGPFGLVFVFGNCRTQMLTFEIWNLSKKLERKETQVFRSQMVTKWDTKTWFWFGNLECMKDEKLTKILWENRA